MKIRLALYTLIAMSFVLNIAPANACSSREECEAQRALSRRNTHATGGPDPEMVCFRVLMRDPRLGLRMTIRYADGREHIEEYPVGSAQHAAGRSQKRPNRLPIFCIKDWKLRGAVWAKICTATEGDGGSATFNPADIQYLLMVRHIPEDKPACLLGTAIECGFKNFE